MPETVGTASIAQDNFDVRRIAPEDRFPGWPLVGGGAPDEGGAADDGGGSTGLDDGDGGDGGPGAGADDGGDGGDPADLDLQQIAADLDAEALAELGDIDDADPESDQPEDGSGTGKRSARRASAVTDPALQAFIDKNYDGNITAFLAAQHTSRQEAKRLADENRALKDKLSRPARASKDELKALIDADPDVAAINQRITQASTQITALRTRQNDIATESTKIDAVIKRLSAELPHIDDQKEHSKKVTELVNARADLQSLITEFESNDNKIETRQGRLEDLQDRLARAKREIENDVEAEEEEREEAEGRDARTRQTFDDAFAAVIAPFGLNPQSERHRYVYSSTKAQMADYLDSLGNKARGLTPMDMFTQVSKLVGAYARSHGMKPTGKKPGNGSGGARPTVPHQPSTRRMVVTPPSNGQGARRPNAPAPTRTKDDLMSDPDYVRKRAERLAEHIGKQAATKARRG